MCGITLRLTVLQYIYFQQLCTTIQVSNKLVNIRESGENPDISIR